MMTSAEAKAISYAIANETNPNHLVGFAAALAPEHAVPAGLLWARAQLIERRRSFAHADLHAALAHLAAIAEGRASVPTDPSHATLTAQVYALSQPLHRDPRLIFCDVLKVAGSLAIDNSANVGDVPVPVADLARRLVCEITPGIRFVHPHAATLPTSPMFTPPSQKEERARWVHQYLREAAIRAGAR